MEKIIQIINIISHISLGVIIVSTVIVRLTPTKSDDKKLTIILKDIHKYMGLFPTLGKNPLTKELEQQVQDLNDIKG